MKNKLNKNYEFFSENGYVVVDGLVDINSLDYLLDTFLCLLKTYIKKENLVIPKLGMLSKAELIDAMLIALQQQAPRTLTDVQRILSRLPEFFYISSNTQISRFIKTLLNKPADSPLYTISNCVTFDFPQESSEGDVTADFHTQWHDDTFWTIPESQYVHIWIPLIHDADKNIGTLQVCPGSHKQGWHGRHEFHPDTSFNYRYGVKKEEVEKYKPIQVEVKRGQMLFFDRHLIHASGENLSEHKVRSTILGMYHDATNPTFMPPTVSVKFRGKTPESWYYELYGDKRIEPIMEEQLDLSSKPPQGI